MSDAGNDLDDTERGERRERAFKHDFARAMWNSLPHDARETLRESCKDGEDTLQETTDE